MDWVLFGGEDHGLLATFPADKEIPKEFKVIGVVKDFAGDLVQLDGNELQPKGWDSITG